MPVQTVAEFQMTEVAPIFDNLPEPIHSEEIKTMEEFDQGWGSMLYRTTLKGTDSQSRLTITDAHDYAQVFIDGKYIGKMDRRLGEKVLTLPSVREGAVLAILVRGSGCDCVTSYGITLKGVCQLLAYLLAVDAPVK